jgi:6-phosphogluconolactonase
MNRRNFIKGISSTAVVTTITLNARRGFALADNKDLLLLVGTYTTGTQSKGIYTYRFNSKTGSLRYVSTTDNVTDPSYLTTDTSGRFLYAVNETLEYDGKKSGAVSSFALNRQNGTLTLLNKQPSLGGAPCYITLSKDEHHAIVANYIAGNLSVYPIDSTGRLGASSDLVQHVGTGPRKDRQEAAHAHSIDLDRNGIFAGSCDLGADKIYLYKFDSKSGRLTPNPSQEFFQSPAGTGPRHLKFHPRRDLAFVINELACTVTALKYDPAHGTLTEIQTISTLPMDWVGENTCAELHISPDGNILFGSNRGHDSIVGYKIDQTSGRLSVVAHTSTGGQVPRNFIIDPTGGYLLAANQKSNNIVVFALDRSTGKLQPTGTLVDVPAPVCLRLI